MTTSDAISVCNIVATVLAVMAAPIIALWIGGKIQQKTNDRQQQLQLLSVLMSFRHQPLSPENFRALNLIDTVFVENPKVREAWSNYFVAINDSAFNSPAGYSIREEKRRDLIMAIIEALGLSKKISSADVLRTYTPNAIVEAEHLAIWERIKRREDLRAEFIKRGIGFPDFVPVIYPPPAGPPKPPTGDVK